MYQPNNLTANFIRYVGELAANNVEQLEVVGDNTKRLRRVLNKDVTQLLSHVQEAWVLPMGLTEDSLRVLTQYIERYELWAYVFSIHAKARAGLEIQSGHWEGLITNLANGLSPVVHANEKCLLGVTTQNSIPTPAKITEVLKTNPWLVTLVALNLADRILGVPANDITR